MKRVDLKALESMVDDKTCRLRGKAFAPSAAAEPIAEFTRKADQTDELTGVDGPNRALLSSGS